MDMTWAPRLLGSERRLSHYHYAKLPVRTLPPQTESEKNFQYQGYGSPRPHYGSTLGLPKAQSRSYLSILRPLSPKVGMKLIYLESEGCLDAQGTFKSLGSVGNTQAEAVACCPSLPPHLGLQVGRRGPSMPIHGWPGIQQPLSSGENPLHKAW